MAKIEYRAYIQSHDLIGAGFLEDIITVAKQGGEIDSDQTRLSFPHNATMFLESDSVIPNTPTITYTVLTQMFTSVDDLEALSIDEFRKEMKLVGIPCRNRSDATNLYVSKYFPRVAKVEEDTPIEVVVEQPETGLEDVVTEEVSLPPSEVVQDVVEPSVAVVEVKESEIVPEVTVKKRGPKGK